MSEGQCKGGEAQCLMGEGQCKGGEAQCLMGEGQCKGGEAQCLKVEGQCKGGEAQCLIGEGQIFDGDAEILMGDRQILSIFATMKALVVLIAIIVSPILSFAWGKEGHEMVGKIAEHFLADSVKAKVKKVLGRMSFEEAGTWMDDIKSDHSYDYMREWHYIDFSKDSVFRLTKEKNAVTVLNASIYELKNKMATLTPKEIRTRVLIIFHLMGDLHQPLHTGYPEDRGGNDVIVSFLRKSNTNRLHFVWDGDIIEEKNITIKDCLGVFEKLTPADFNKINTRKILDWMNESRAFLPQVYAIKDGIIDKQYVDTNAEVIKRQLLTAGLRLKNVLTDIFS